MYLPHTPDVAQCIRNARAEQQARHDAYMGVEHLALGLLSVTRGPAPAILDALGVPAPALRAAVADGCRATGEPPRA